MAGKTAISSASAKLHAHVYAHGINKGQKTFGLVLTKEQAVVLATNILAVAGATNAEGKILVTGHPDRKNLVTILRRYR